MMDSVFSRSTQPDRPTWLALAERCEQAAGPDCQLDMDVFEACGWEFIGIDGDGTWARGYGDLFEATSSIAEFTASLDAITALIERELPGHGWFLGAPIKAENASVFAYLRGKSGYSAVRAVAPALALCAAFCRAMAEKASA